MKYLLIGMLALTAASCAHDQQEGNNKWDGIQQQEDVEQEEATRTGKSDEIGPTYDQNGRTSSPAPVSAD